MSARRFQRQFQEHAVKKYLMVLMVAFAAMSLAVSNVEAKRLGGGGTFGKQSQNLSKPAPTTAPSPTQSGNTAQPAPASPAPGAPQAPLARPASPWKGILGGALAGLGLGMLFSHLGMGGGMLGSLVMIFLLAMVVMFVMRMFRRGGDQPAYAGGAPSSTAYTPEIGSRIEPASQSATSQSATSQSATSQPAALQAAPGASGNPAPWGIPADFDTQGFLRNAKTHFIRLQAAWDKADVNDIREFTTPETFAELRMQIQERGASPNNTDVVSLDAELLGIETVGSDYLASVKFSGMIKEAANAPAESFAEVWNLSKPTSGQGGWLLAGIQQLS
jgi:predicted lipid-binding transport protein (Tim44 family)